MTQKRVLVALSGGVDSAVAALRLSAMGYQVAGVNFLLHSDDTGSGAEALCRQLGIPFERLDLRQEFRQAVIAAAAGEYIAGRTPNPCCECNEQIKFAFLHRCMKEGGFDFIATGHFVSTCCRDSICRVVRGADRGKDQSYFLYRVPPEILKNCIFPLGGITKPEVREEARKAGLSCSEKPESQDICFAVPGECCGDTLLRLAGLAESGCCRPGDFIYEGCKVGTHQGIHRYTVGQRKGLGVALGRPGYVRKLDAKSGTVELVTDEELLAAAEFSLGRCVWHGGIPAGESGELTVQIRYRSFPVPAGVEVDAADPQKAKVRLAAPLRAVTPGQAAVFYCGGEVIGGGVIDDGVLL